jgi:flagella basal body P-ring formation protein FlgA
MIRILKISLLILAAGIFSAGYLYGQSTFSGERLESLVEEFVKSENPDEIDIKFISRITDMEFPESGVTAGIKSNVRKYRGAFNISLEFYHNEKTLNIISVPVKVTKPVNIPVAANTIASGSEIMDNDIEFITVDEYSYDGLIKNPGDIVGSSVNRSLPKGRPFTKDLLDGKILIRRGDVVEIIVRSGAVTIKATGAALQDGAEGQQVRVKRNKSGNTIITGTVTKFGQVLIGSNSLSYK